MRQYASDSQEKMRCVSVTLLLCLATTLFTQVTCQINGLSYCPCLKTSEWVIPKKQIESYMIQRAGVCHIDAVLIKTVKGHFFCINPQKPWVKIAMEFVDKKKAAVETTARPINSASTSTLNNTSHWNTTG